MSEGVEYYSIAGAPGRYFVCPRGVGKLSDTACSKLYGEAMSPKGLREGLRFKCRGCPLGAQHSGIEPLEQVASKLLSSLSCTRCLNPAARLIRGKICVSCYNREREYLTGRNAKGNAPVRVRPVMPATVAYKDGDSVQVRQIDCVASRLEAFLSVIRSESRSVSFRCAMPQIQREGGDAARSIRLG